MQHIEAGTLHAFIDGELPSVEAKAMEHHLAVCAPCRALLAEARELTTEADHLVVALDGVAPALAPPTVAAPPARRFRPSRLAWAATVILAVGLGYSLRQGATPASSPSGAVREDVDQRQTGVPIAALPAAQPSSARGEVRSDRVLGAGANKTVAASPAPPTAAESSAPTGGVAATSPSAPPAALATSEDAPQRTVRPAVNGSIVMIDGAPVDTSKHSLGFGPADHAAPRRITLDEAVTQLGGSIRLIDGLAPQRVELLSGVDVAGADPDRQVIRVYYEEPDLGLVTLDQQRPAPSFARRDSRDSMGAFAEPKLTLNPGPTEAAPRLRAAGSLRPSTLVWRSDGVWLALTSRLAGSTMAQLQARVK